MSEKKQARVDREAHIFLLHFFAIVSLVKNKHWMVFFFWGGVGGGKCNIL